MALSLQKNEKLSLVKDNGDSLKSVRLALGWDMAQQKKGGLMGFLSGGSGGDEIDLDASILMFEGTELKEIVYFGSLRSKDGSIIHSGDNLTGAGDGDDEVINVNLSQVPAQITALSLVITSYSNHTFNQVQNAFARVVDNDTNQEVVRYELSEQPNNTGVVIANLVREGNAWVFKAIGQFANAKTPNLLENAARTSLR